MELTARGGSAGWLGGTRKEGGHGNWCNEWIHLKVGPKEREKKGGGQGNLQGGRKL